MASLQVFYLLPPSPLKQDMSSLWVGDLRSSVKMKTNK